jgi:uncharacterized protein RhaS with RHS repeats
LQVAHLASGCPACGYKTASGRGKWLSRDPIGENGGLNLYGYVGNNPISAIDPLGLCKCDELLQRIRILLNDSNQLLSDLNGQLGNEETGEAISTTQMVLTEGLEAGTAAATAFESGAGIVAKNVKPWLKLGGGAMSDYAKVTNAGTIRSAVTGTGSEVLGSQVADPLAKAATLGTAAYASDNFADALEYGQGTMAIARQSSDRLQSSYNGLLYQIKNLQGQYSQDCQ